MNDWATWCWRSRTGCRMTQAEAAAAVGVAERTWRRWEGWQGVPPEWRRDQVRDVMTGELVAAGAAPTSSPTARAPR